MIHETITGRRLAKPCLPPLLSCVCGGIAFSIIVLVLVVVVVRMVRDVSDFVDGSFPSLCLSTLCHNDVPSPNSCSIFIQLLVVVVAVVSGWSPRKSIFFPSFSQSVLGIEIVRLNDTRFFVGVGVKQTKESEPRVLFWLFGLFLLLVPSFVAVLPSVVVVAVIVPVIVVGGCSQDGPSLLR